MRFELAPITGLHIADLDVADSDTGQGEHNKACLRAHLADLAVATLAEGKCQQVGVVASDADDSHLYWLYKVAIDLHTRTQQSDFALLHLAGNMGDIGLGVAVAWVGEVLDQSTII